MTRRTRRSGLRTFGWPIAIAALTVAGLAAGLMGSGAFDAFAVAALLVAAVPGWWRLCGR